jgi:hypothetical protein
MQPSSSRAGMTTESSVSGRSGLVSGGLGIFYEMLGIRKALGIPPSVVANWVLWA